MVFARYVGDLRPARRLRRPPRGRRGHRWCCRRSTTSACARAARCRPALTIAKMAAIGVLAGRCCSGMGRRTTPAVDWGRSRPRGFLRGAGGRAVRVRRLAHGDLRGGGDARARAHDPPRADARHAWSCVVYLALNAAYLLVLPLDAVLASTPSPSTPTRATAWSGRRLGDLAAGDRVVVRRDERHHPGRAARVLAMAEDGLLVQVDGRRSIPRFQTPYRAIVVQASVVVDPGARPAPTVCIVSRVVYTEWIFFGALALGMICAARGARLRTGVSSLGIPGRADRLRARLPGDCVEPDRRRPTREPDRAGAGRRRTACLLLWNTAYRPPHA